MLNSFVLDYLIRQRVSAHVSFFFIYQLPVPRLTEADPRFAPIVERAARLICTTLEYDALAAEVGLGDHSAGVTDPAERARLRAELDGLVAHLYGLSEQELTHILGTFPLLAAAQREAVLTAWAYAPNPDDAQVAALLAAGARELEEEAGLRIDPAAIREFAVRSAPDGTLLVFGLAAPLRAGDLPPFTPTAEANGRLVIHAPMELAFPLHAEVAAVYFAHDRP